MTYFPDILSLVNTKVTNCTCTKKSISRISRLAAALEVSSGIYAGCILIAVMASVAAFIDI